MTGARRSVARCLQTVNRAAPPTLDPRKAPRRGVLVAAAVLLLAHPAAAFGHLALQQRGSQRPLLCWHLRSGGVRSAEDDSPFSFQSNADEKPPSFSFLSSEKKKKKKKNAVDIENEKRAKFLAQQREFQKNKRDTSYQPGLEAFSVGSAADEIGDALSSGPPIPLAAVLIGGVGLLGAVYLVLGLLFG